MFRRDVLEDQHVRAVHLATAEAVFCTQMASSAAHRAAVVLDSRLAQRSELVGRGEATSCRFGHVCAAEGTGGILDHSDGPPGHSEHVQGQRESGMCRGCEI